MNAFRYLLKPRILHENIFTIYYKYIYYEIFNDKLLFHRVCHATHSLHDNNEINKSKLNCQIYRYIKSAKKSSKYTEGPNYTKISELIK
jgi:hypothetical protein